MSRLICWFPTVLNALTVVSAAAVWLLLMNDTLFYHAGSSVRDIIVVAFTISVFAQCVRAVMPCITTSLRSPRRLLVAGGAILLLTVMIHLATDFFLNRELDRFRADRIAYAGESDVDILRAFTDRNFYYPPESFLQHARATIPEGDAVLTIGDIRPDPVNYALYPRPVYALPDLQRATLASAVAAWSREPDPAFDDGFAAWLQDASVDEAAVAQATRDLIQQRNIRWVVVVDTFDESRNRVIPIGDSP